MLIKGFRYVVLFVVILGSSSLFAHVVGVYGQVFPIKEENAIDFLHKKLAHMQEDGELQSYQNQFKSNVKLHSLRPKANFNLTVSDKSDHFYPDMRFVLKHNIRYSDGILMYPKGTRINPMKFLKWQEHWLFLDADDAHQVQWGEFEISKLQGRIKIILIKGNVLKATKIFKQAIYFDQYGKFANKFHLKHIPDLVYQLGNRLRVNEYDLNDRGSW